MVPPLCHQIITALEEDSTAQKMQLGYRLQQIAAAVENKVTDLWLNEQDYWDWAASPQDGADGQRQSGETTEQSSSKQMFNLQSRFLLPAVPDLPILSQQSTNSAASSHLEKSLKFISKVKLVG